ncbi:arsenate reductase family protein [Cohnella fermenti]|uniref:Arsenate reductase family protein n=1 Tax=Cohnella fermenti TaxID=2565925 RepID=A0A4S4BMM4_9BACL|nr:arsenate reductase family protein [Cohnella fermenti]THF76084.1 arsenate reductase family protein [Cohnella fermenti]
MSKSLIVYHYPNCGTCRDAVKWLRSRGHELELRHIVETPPSAEELKKLIRLSGLPIQKWFNVSGNAYKELGLKDKLPKLSDDERISLLASNGMLIKRPVIADGEMATVGFKEEELAKVW